MGLIWEAHVYVMTFICQGKQLLFCVNCDIKGYFFTIQCEILDCIHVAFYVTVRC